MYNRPLSSATSSTLDAQMLCADMSWIHTVHYPVPCTHHIGLRPL